MMSLLVLTGAASSTKKAGATTALMAERHEQQSIARHGPGQVRRTTPPSRGQRTGQGQGGGERDEVHGQVPEAILASSFGQGCRHARRCADRVCHRRGATDTVHRLFMWTFSCATQTGMTFPSKSAYGGMMGFLTHFASFFALAPVMPEFSASFSALDSAVHR